MRTTAILVGVDVDDLLVTSNNVKIVEDFFEEMKAFDDVKDLGLGTKFLVLKIEYEMNRGYNMSQQLMMLNMI
jgi:hypothetical protein